MDKPVINISDFINQTGADQLIDDIQKACRLPDGSMPPVSDMIKTETDANGNSRTYQYVNYVQEGGGVLGVALLGYTYVLEKLGIRFYKLAGTSAGAINTMLTAAIDPSRYEKIAVKHGGEPLLKSEAVLYELINKDLFEMVDGAPFARKVIRKFLQRKDYIARIIDSLITFVTVFIVATLLLGLLSALNIVLVLPQAWWWLTTALGIVVFISILAIVVLYLGSKRYMHLFVKSKYGICTGNDFHSWITDILAFNSVNSTADLETEMHAYQKGVHLRAERVADNITNDAQPVSGSDIILITSDITNQRKVEFPAMAKYYWDKPDTTNPADFVRASMAIPIFFEPFTRKVTHAPASAEEKLILQNIPDNTSPASPCEVRFVDGGILSNFPINVFHNPNITIARLPTFGVKLEDEAHEIPGAPRSLKQSLGNYLGNIFSTVRFYYDRDFLLKNQLYEKTIGHVDVNKFNWLNFFLNEKDKINLFRLGAEAAKTFFLGGEIWVDGKRRQFEGFNWEQYKIERANVVKTERNETPENIVGSSPGRRL